PSIYQHVLEERLRQIRIPTPEAEGPPRPQGEHHASEDRLHGGGAPGPEIPVEHRLSEGDPAAEILRVADEVGADLIGMGTNGRTGPGRLLMGSVAEAVLRGARCPVLMVKAPVAVAAGQATAPGSSTML